MAKLTFDQALEAISNEQHVTSDQVQASALRRKIWSYYYSAPGCLPDSFGHCTTKKSALESCQFYADDAPRGFMTELRRSGIAAADANGYYRVELVRQTLGDIL